MVDTPERTSTCRHTKSMAIYGTFPLKGTQKPAEKVLYIKQMRKKLELNREKRLKHNFTINSSLAQMHITERELPAPSCGMRVWHTSGATASKTSI